MEPILTAATTAAASHLLLPLSSCGCLLQSQGISTFVSQPFMYSLASLQSGCHIKMPRGVGWQWIAPRVRAPIRLSPCLRPSIQRHADTLSKTCYSLLDFGEKDLQELR